MRWDNLRLDVQERDDRVPLPLFDQGAVARTFDTPEFRGMTFYEIRAKSIINSIPESFGLPFRYSINPYRGCGHRCLYCFARKSHTYLDLDYGEDFDTKVVVKVNAPELLRKELAASSWRGEHIAMGTNVDPYQRAEGRYRLMRGILEALREAANPFSILTKGTLILRDLDLLSACSQVADVATNLSVGSVDDALWRAVEPGTPSPRRRLDAVRRLNEAGIPCGVLMAPIIPFLSDTDDAIEETVTAIAASGVTHVLPVVLHLRKGGPREWWTSWLRENRPDLVPRYRELYGNGAYAPKDFQRQVTDRVHRLAERFGIGRSRSGGEARRIPEPPPEPEQLTLA